MNPEFAFMVTIRLRLSLPLPCFFVYYIPYIYAVLEFQVDLENRKMFTTIWSKVFAHQRALVSVLSSPLANWTLTPLCTSYWPRESKICLSVGQSSLKQTPKLTILLNNIVIAFFP